MPYILAIGLTFLFSWVIIKLITKYKISDEYLFLNSQSAMHEKIKMFIPEELYVKPKIITQSEKLLAKSMMKVIVLDNKAYWTHNNKFYVADVINHGVLEHTTEEVDTYNMPSEELDKMLFILDTLRDGKTNDSSSTGD